jgi:anti-sigma factor RsiW
VPTWMTCRELIELLQEYLDGALAADVRAHFEQHLAACASCATYLETYETTVELGRAAFTHPDDAVPSDVPEDLVQAILAARRRKT